MRMNTPTVLLIASLFIAMSLGLLARAGDLAPPPGLIQSTDAVRLNKQAITLPFVITEPGVYRLTNNLTGVAGQSGIIIDANNVTIDLNGFSLVGVSGSGEGILVMGTHRNIAIRNGFIHDWEMNGILAMTAENCHIVNVNSSDNGNRGMLIGNGSLVTACITNSNGNDGINAQSGSTISGCTARGNTHSGIIGGQSLIRGNTATENVLNIVDIGGSTIIDNHAP